MLQSKFLRHLVRNQIESLIIFNLVYDNQEIVRLFLAELYKYLHRNYFLVWKDSPLHFVSAGEWVQNLFQLKFILQAQNNSIFQPHWQLFFP